MGSRADDDFASTKNTYTAVKKVDLQSFWSDKARGTRDQLRSAGLEVREMHIDQTGDHFTFPITDSRHIDFKIVLGDAEFFTSLKVGSDLGTMDDIFAREAGDIGAGTAD